MGSWGPIASNLFVRSRICAGLSSGGSQYHRLMISCAILTRSLWYLLDDSFEIEIKRGRLEKRKRVLIEGYWFMESGSMPGRSWGV